MYLSMAEGLDQTIFKDRLIQTILWFIGILVCIFDFFVFLIRIIEVNQMLPSVLLEFEWIHQSKEQD